MAESKNSFIQSKMNKDLDERLIPNNVYRDALNVAVSRSEGSDVGALESVLGNASVSSSDVAVVSSGTNAKDQATLLIKQNTNVTVGMSIYNEAGCLLYGKIVSFTLANSIYTLTLDANLPAVIGPEETNLIARDVDLKIIGQYVDEANSLVYFFKTNYTGLADVLPSANPLVNYKMTVEVYNSSTSVTSVLVSGNFLNFSTLSNIYGVNLIENLLFWTDNRNAPRKININNISTYYTNADQISVCKWAPFLAPEFIDLRSTSLLKPSTMSDASDLPVVSVGGSQVASKNLATKKYRNGDAIPQVTTTQDWIDANTNETGAWCYYDNSQGNGVSYGLLYNKWAVNSIAPRLLAPLGYTIPTSAQLKAMTPLTPTQSGVFLKATGYEYWTDSTVPADEGQNTKGFNARGAGTRGGIVGADFVGLKNETTYWPSDEDTFVKLEFNNKFATHMSALAANPKKAGRSVRVVKESGYNGWNGDPEYLTDKFAKFSYRFKFNDNEYSLVAPFSQDVFIPEQDGHFVNDDENQAFITTVVEFMQNTVNNAVLNITLPSIDIVKDYNIKAIDIIIKESDAQAYSVIETIKVDNVFVAALNGTNVYQYTYESLLPIKTLTLQQTTRVFDKVPVKALAQETSGNRVMYGNFTQGYGVPLGLDYYVENSQKSVQQFVEYPQHSIKQNRNYQVGLILADKYGRETDIILSLNDDKKDSNGNPIPGSNIFIDYENISFNNEINSWLGNNLRLQFNTPGIPEDENANNTTSTYPGAYAKGNYYEVTVPEAPGPYLNGKSFRDLSNQSITATAGQTEFIFYGMGLGSYEASIVTDNSYALYKNNDGWVLVPAADYTYTASGAAPSSPRVVLNTGAIVGDIYKLRVLYTSDNLNKYYAGSAKTPLPAVQTYLFPNFSTIYSTYFYPGKELKGLYCDYSAIKTVTPLDYTESGVKLTYAVELFTTEELDARYIFQNVITNNPSFPQPELILNKTFATYDINPRGFYSYRIGIKQQQQDYYNIYLPGIINGYPLNDITVEVNETAFTTLISDNINKVPRNLQDVGPLQNQFTSDTTMWGRVMNIPRAANPDTAQGGVTFTQQYYPSSSPDSADLVGTIADAFPGLGDGTTTAGEINSFCIYDYTTKPYVAKVSTQSGIGQVENLWTAPNAAQGNFPYANSLSLAVYETTPVKVPFELFYETSTSDLVSELNIAIQGANTAINGMVTPTVTFNEGDPVGTQITTSISPTINGTVYTNATFKLLSVFNFLSTGELNNVNFAGEVDGVGNNNNIRFAADSVNAGSLFLKTSGTNLNGGGTFYAGSTVEGDLNKNIGGRFQYAIEWTDGNGLAKTVLTGILELQNSQPVISLASNTSNLVVGAGGTEFIYGSSGSIGGGGGSSPRGTNGSARNSQGLLGQDPPYGNQSIFNVGSAGDQQAWTILEIEITDATGAVFTYPEVGAPNPQTQLDDRFQILFSGITGSAGDANRTCGFNLWVNRALNPLAFSTCYKITYRLTDTLGTSDAGTGNSVTFCTPGPTYTSVHCTNYTSGANAPSSQTPVGTIQLGGAPNLGASPQVTRPVWQGQIQNWKDVPVYLWIRLTIPQANDLQFTALATNSKASTTGFGQNPANGGQPAGDVQAFMVPGAARTKYTNSTAVLDAFDATSIMIANSVRPGQVGVFTDPNDATSVTTYNYKTSAIVNLQFSLEPPGPYSNATSTWEGEIMWTTVAGNLAGQDPTNFAGTKGGSISPVSQGSIPPFYSNIEDGTADSGSQINPTFTPISAGPNA